MVVRAPSNTQKGNLVSPNLILEVSLIWNHTDLNHQQNIYSAWKQDYSIHCKWLSSYYGTLKQSTDIKHMSTPLNLKQKAWVKLMKSPCCTLVVCVFCFRISVPSSASSSVSWQDLHPFIHLSLPSPPLSHRTGLGCWVSRRPKRFFTVTRCRENLSSGEKRAGWAELVGSPSGFTFCGDKEGKRLWNSLADFLAWRY